MHPNVFAGGAVLLSAVIDATDPGPILQKPRWMQTLEEPCQQPRHHRHRWQWNMHRCPMKLKFHPHIPPRFSSWKFWWWYQHMLAILIVHRCVFINDSMTETVQSKRRWMEFPIHFNVPMHVWMLIPWSTSQTYGHHVHGRWIYARSGTTMGWSGGSMEPMVSAASDVSWSSTVLAADGLAGQFVRGVSSSAAMLWVTGCVIPKGKKI